MPRTLGGIIGFIIVSTITVMVGTYVYNKLVAPALARVMQKAA